MDDRRIAPPQAIAVDEDNTTQDTPAIDPRHAMAPREVGPKPGHLCVCQPEKIAHRNLCYFGSLKQEDEATSGRSMRPEPRKDPTNKP